MVQVRCDTDFVAMNEEFLEFVDNMAMGLAALKQDTWMMDLLYQDNPVTDQLFMEDVLDARKKFGEDIRLVHHQVFQVYDELDHRGDPVALQIEKV